MNVLKHLGLASTAAAVTLLAEWKVLEFAWDATHTRAQYIIDGTFVQENNIMTGIKVWEDTVYVTVPRWRHGVPSTLNTIALSTTTDKTGSVLTPFPSWAMNKEDDCSAFQYVQSMEIDPGGVMWVIDIGRLNLADDPVWSKTICPPKIVRIDLRTGLVLSTYVIPDSSANHTTNFINDIVLDVHNQVAYVSNLDSTGSLLIYDHINQRSRQFSDPASMAPQVVNWTIGPNFYGKSLSFSMDGIALTPDASRVYYTPLSGQNMSSVDTSLLRDFNKTDAEIQATIIRGITRRDSSDGMTFDCAANLYYGGLTTASVYSWDVNSGESSMAASSIVYDAVPWADTFAFNGTELYFTANTLDQWFTHQMNFSQINVRIFKHDVSFASYMAGPCTPVAGTASHVAAGVSVVVFIASFA